MDIGSGIGGSARWLASNHGWEVDCFDINQPGVEATKEINKLFEPAEWVNKINVTCQDVLTLGPEFDNKYDTALVQNVLFHMDDEYKVRFLKKVLQCLKPGGFFFIDDFGCYRAWKEDEEFGRLIC